MDKLTKLITQIRQITNDIVTIEISERGYLIRIDHLKGGQTSWFKRTLREAHETLIKTYNL